MPLGEDVNGGTRPLTGLAGDASPNARALGMKDIDPEKYRGIAVPLYTTLDDTTTSGYDVYRVPTTHDFIIEKILPHVVLTDLATEVATPIGNAAVPSVADRIAMKAMNAQIDLQNTDRVQKIIDNHSLSLASLLSAAGGNILDFTGTPHKIPAGETIRLDVKYAATGAAAANMEKGKTQYGVVLVGKLVRVAKS